MKLNSAVVIAAADLGTNTIKISCVRVSPDGRFETLLEGAETIRLGAGTEQTGRIDPARLERCVEVLREYEAQGRDQGAEVFIGVATEALRVARNGGDLMGRIVRDTAWEIRLIPGEEEARLTFVGLRDHLPAGGRALIVDIGGGSTELVCTDHRALIARESLPLGSGRLADRFLRSDPPPHEALDAAVYAAKEALTGNALLDRADTVMLSGGNGMFLQQLVHQLLPDHSVSSESIERLLDDFAAVPAATTATRLGIAHERARVLPAGGAIALAVLRLVAPREVICVPSGIRTGLIREWLAQAGHA